MRTHDRAVGETAGCAAHLETAPDEKEQARNAGNKTKPMLSSFEGLPTEILRRIVASEVQTSHAIVRDQGGCLRYELNPSVLLTSKTVFAKCIRPWTCNRLVRITYKGDARYRPTAFVPIVGSNAYRILTMSDKSVRATFTADLNVFNKLSSQELRCVVPTENVCVITVDAACTWLSILGCQQFAKHAYHEEPPAFRLDLIMHDSSTVPSRKGGDISQILTLMLRSSTDANVNAAEDKGSEIAERQQRIWPGRPHEMTIGGSIYSAWISSLQTHRHMLAALRNYRAQLDYCACVCKQLIGINRLRPSSVVERLLPSEKSIIAQYSCAALLNWTYEYDRSALNEGPLAELKESWQRHENSTCIIEGCPCLLWTALNLGAGRVVSRGDAARHGINFLPWLEVHRWTIALHCRRCLVEGDYNGLVDAREHMLKVLAYLQPEELQRGFDQDLESFTIAASLGIPSLANLRGVAMVDEDDESQVDALWDCLNLVKEQVGKSVEWRVQGCSIIVEAATRIPSHMVVEADIIPAEPLASLFDRKRR
jgi:hypothetical protein